MKNINVKMQQLLLLLCISLMASFSTYAQGSSITSLKPVFERLKSLKMYSYEAQTKVVFPNGQKDQRTVKIYMDRVGKRLSYKSEDQLVMLNRQWLFRADNVNKTASVFNIVSYDKKNKGNLPTVESIFQYDLASMFIDSVVALYGEVLSTTKKEAIIIYKVSFAKQEAALKEMTIAYNTITQLPEYILFKVESDINQSGKAMQTEIVCKGYTLNIPESVFDDSQYFTIEKGKPILTQFKNYKVYSVL